MFHESCTPAVLSQYPKANGVLVNNPKANSRQRLLKTKEL